MTYIIGGVAASIYMSYRFGRKIGMDPVLAPWSGVFWALLAAIIWAGVKTWSQ
jgi:hypothetical protein